jgi:hypothetical protein
MAQADRVLSTPPTNTSARHSRRSILSAIAVGSAAAAIAAKPVTAMAVSSPDPIYAVIERHRDLAKICDAAWKVRGKCKDFGTLTEAEQAHVRKLNDAVDKAHLPLEAAAENLINTPRRRTPASSLRFFTCESRFAMTASTWCKAGWRTRAMTASATSTGAMHGLRPSSRPSCSSTTRRCGHEHGDQRGSETGAGKSAYW